MGIDRKSIQAINPRCVHVHMPGFASTDAEQAELEAWEANILAASGVFTGMGLNRQLAGKPASYSPLPLASAYASVTAALAITCALYRREMAGESDPELHIEVPLASALLDALVHNSLQYEAPEIYHSRRQRALSVPRASPLDYFETLELTDPFYSHYTCADARPFYIVAPCHLRHQKNAIKVLGIEEQVRALGVPLAATYGDATHAASRHGLGAGQVGDAWAAPLRRLLRRAFVTKTAYEWEALFGAAGVPGAAHRTTVEWLDSPHVRAAGLVREDAKGQLRPGAVVWVAEEEIPIRKTKSRSACLSVSSEYQKPVHDSTSDPGVHARVPPTTNRTTATICHAQACEPPAPRRAASCHSSTELHGPPCEAAPPQFAAQDTRKEEDRVTCNGKDGSPSAVHEARDHDERCRIGRTGPWLSGVTILDLANVIAGPTIGAMLARYGADVIKIDPPRPTYSPEVRHYRVTAWCDRPPHPLGRSQAAHHTSLCIGNRAVRSCGQRGQAINPAGRPSVFGHHQCTCGRAGHAGCNWAGGFRGACARGGCSSLQRHLGRARTPRSDPGGAECHQPQRYPLTL